ncbi:MAG: hypothetical protein BMS9Abin36_0083 [Gammaproteobacteria bacterium]|nr:MAG: hypothetical protein BMS9Abin36_0083 [Gammaproteobacteria bacterium]
MAEDGINDPLIAKRKALKRLGLPDKTPLPSNTKVEQALSRHLALFDRDATQKRLLRLRQLALETMEFLVGFSPLVSGGVVSGTVTAQTGIELHLTADTPEAIAHCLINHHIPYLSKDYIVNMGHGQTLTVPGFCFQANQTTIMLKVFSPTSSRQAPWDTASSQAAQRWSRARLATSLRDPQ